MKVAFVGLGLMGQPMAARVLAAGYPLTVHSRRRTSAAGLLASGATWAPSPRDAAAEADVVLTMLPDGPAVEEVLLGPDGALRAGREQQVVDLSTIGPASATHVGDVLARGGCGFVDAPVSGGPPAAVAGTLSIMAGGDPAVYAAVEPVLRTMGLPVLLGPPGSGQRTKLVNQVLIAGIMGGLAEAFALADRGGLDLATTLEAARGGMAGSRLLDWAWPKMVEHDDAPGFKIGHLVKDLHLALDEAGTRGVELDVVRTVLAGYVRAAECCGSDAGTQALAQGVRRRPDPTRNRS